MASTKKILVSGIKPTGLAHIGSYLGMMKNCVQLQDSYQAYYFIADYHALTIDIAPETLREYSQALIIDLLSVGIDPKKAVLFRQSDVPEHLELSWIFSCLMPVTELERMTQYKDMVQEKKTGANAGLFTYPVLQAADILIYKGEYVPVGEDQLQHLELSRIIARKFNNRYQEFFPEVKPVLSENVRVMSLNDPAKKMSKHLGPKSYVALRDSEEIVNQKIAKAVTDSLAEDTTISGGHNLLMLYKNFAPAENYDSFKREYKLKTLSYSHLKKDLAERINAFLEPIREKRKYYEDHPAEVERILTAGGKKARSLAQKTIEDVRKIIGLK